MKPSLRSKLNNIQLLLLVKSSSVAEFGIDRVLQPIVDDIKKLECVSILCSHFRVLIVNYCTNNLG